MRRCKEAILAGVRDKQTSRVLLMDGVVPLSLGVQCEGRQFAKVVQPWHRDSVQEEERIHHRLRQLQDEIDVRIFEGERSNTDGNHLLGEFQISGIERAAAGEPN